MTTCEAHKLTPTPRRKRGLSVAGTASRHVFLDPSLVELVLEACVSLNDVKLLSGVSRATRRARWPFETLSGHVGIRAMIARSGDDTSFENWARTAEAPKLSDANIAAMVEQLSSYRAMAASGGLLRQLCPGCTQTLREGLGASCARAAFSLGYSCVRSESGWSNAHAIVGACGHASLFAVAFGESDDLDASRSAGWGPKEACAWALVQLLSVAKKRMSCKALVAQLRQLGVARACADAVLAPLPMLEAGQSKRRASSVGRAARAGDHLRAGSRDYATSDASRELGAQLLYLTSTGDPDYVDQVSACPLERLVSFACDFGHRSFDGKPDARRRARHAAQFAVTHGLHLPQDDDRSASRKLSFARHVVDAAREAVNDAATAKRCTAEARDRVAALALVADSCPDELVNVGAPRVCADVLRNADVLLPAATYGDAASDKALQAVADCVETKSSTRLQCARNRTIWTRLFRCASRARRERSIRPKMSRIDFDLTELENSQVWSGPPKPVVGFHADPETDALTFAQFFSFLHSYDKHALFIRNRAFFDEPRSLQCDVVCRVFFVPFCVFLFCCQGYYWFMMNGVVVDTPKK